MWFIPRVPWVPETFLARFPVSVKSLAASAYGRICIGLQPTPKIPATREKNVWYPNCRVSLGWFMLSAIMSSAFPSNAVLHKHYQVPHGKRKPCVPSVALSARCRCQCQKRYVPSTWLKTEKNRKICGAVEWEDLHGVNQGEGKTRSPTPWSTLWST